VMAAFFWRRATASAAVVSIACGTAVTVFWDLGKSMLGPLAQRDAIFPALIVSVIALVVVSLLSRPPRREQLAPFE